MKPVAWMHKEATGWLSCTNQHPETEVEEWLPLYTHPSGLTNEQIDEVIAELRKKSMDPKRWLDVYSVAIETIIQLREELKEAKNK